MWLTGFFSILNRRFSPTQMNILQKSNHLHSFEVFCLLSKNFLNSFGFFLAIWRRRECVGAVTVRWPLRQSSQIQMVGALSFSFSYATQKPRETHQNHDHQWCAQTSETASSEGNQSDTSFNSFTIKANILCCMHVTDAWNIQLDCKFISA